MRTDRDLTERLAPMNNGHQQPFPIVVGWRLVR